ncbi:ATP-grasp domain-containing protein [Fluviispira multicolorata]|uniref:ATP-grasp domain-containing protein n=1 Tax=Fluviispira multicolorata TaxID=2654512 RepID=A0A833JBZ3_9BACT|nr:ATP-grasp domain-containing protein [Fluviispira multicolorata]KAB8028604.1 ATP-grasp domain-containing protein [Fluviispira multicolorata]
MIKEKNVEKILLVEATFNPKVILSTLKNILDVIPEFFEITLFTSSECFDLLSEALKERFKNIIKFDNFYANPMIEYSVNNLLLKNPNLNVIALREFDLIRVSRACLFNKNLSFNYDSVINYRDKVKMKNKLAENLIPVAKYLPIESATCLLKASKYLGMPFIIKPRCKAAGIGFKVIHSESDIQSYLESIANNLDWDEELNLIAEEFVGSTMYHVDGFVKDGRIIFSTVSRYLGHKPHLAWNAKTASDILTGSLSVKYNTEEYHILNKMTQKTILALGNSQMSFAFHAEIWEKEDKYLVNEIACRIGGGQVMHIFSEQLHFPPEKYLISDILNIKNSYLLPKKSNDEIILVARLLPKAGVRASSKQYLPNNCKIILNVAEGEILNDAVNWYDAFAYLIIRSNSEKNIMEDFWAIHNKIYLNI